MKKAQLAVETLLMYGIVLLIVAVAIAALVGFGVFDLKGLLPTKCEVSGIKLTCDDYLVQESTAGVKLSFVNGMGENINIANITIIGEGDNTGLWGNNCTYIGSSNVASPSPSLNTIPSTPPTPAYLLVNGDRATFSLPNCNVKVKSGKRIGGTLQIRYAKVGNDLIKTATGTIDVNVG